MGDHKADIKIRFIIHNKTYKQDFWINYFPNECGIDRRISEWFKECWDDAFTRYYKKVIGELK